MADDTTLQSETPATAPAGLVVAGDDVSSKFHQRVKLSVGADGAASDAIPVSNGLDTAAAGVQAVGLVAQLDDTGTGTVTENQFGPLRMSPRRALLVEGVASGTVIPISVASVPSHAVTNAGTFAVQDTRAGATTATLANVSAATSSTTLQASNANRRRLILVNDSTSICYVKYGSAASSTSFTYLLQAGETLMEDIYTGIVTGIWVSATGVARMTELTA